MLWVLITGALWVLGFGKFSQWVILAFQSYKALFYLKTVKIIIVMTVFLGKKLTLHHDSVRIYLCDWNKTILTSLKYMFMLVFSTLFSLTFKKAFLLLMTNHSHLMMSYSSVNPELRHGGTVQFSCTSAFPFVSHSALPIWIWNWSGFTEAEVSGYLICKGPCQGPVPSFVLVFFFFFSKTDSQDCIPTKPVKSVFSLC